MQPGSDLVKIGGGDVCVCARRHLLCLSEVEGALEACHL